MLSRTGWRENNGYDGMRLVLMDGGLRAGAKEERARKVGRVAQWTRRVGCISR